MTTSAPLHVLADLDLTVDGQPGRLTADGDVVEVELPAGAIGDGRVAGVGPAAVRRAARRLSDEGLSVRVRSDGDVVAEVGSIADASILGRICGTPVRLRRGAARAVPTPRRGRVMAIVGLAAVIAGIRWLFGTRSGRRQVLRGAAHATIAVTDRD